MIQLTPMEGFARSGSSTEWKAEPRKYGSLESSPNLLKYLLTQNYWIIKKFIMGNPKKSKNTEMSLSQDALDEL